MCSSSRPDSDLSTSGPVLGIREAAAERAELALKYGVDIYL
jgi:hypothetical protein